MAPRLSPLPLPLLARPRAILAAALLLAAFSPLPAEVPAAGGRFLFAGDDDWDWASPLGADEPCKLVRYGALPWSALDWAEEGLDPVRGAIVGTAPDPKKTMTMEELSALRGENATYRHHPQRNGVIAKLLAAAEPPNVIVLMQNTGRDGPLDNDSIAALTRFVRDGGRLVVLDDWEKYQPVLDALVAAAVTLPAGPPIAEAPPPANPGPDNHGAPAPPAPAPDPADQPPADPDRQELEAKFAELLPRLGDESFNVREEASAAILELGPAVLDLFATLEVDDPEIAARLAAIRRELRPPPRPARPAKLTDEQRRAQRHAKIEAAAKVITEAAAKLKAAGASHRLTPVLVDGDHIPMPVLRIAFP